MTYLQELYIYQVAKYLSNDPDFRLDVYDKEDIYQKCWEIGTAVVNEGKASDFDIIYTYINMRMKSWRRDKYGPKQKD